MRRQCIIQGAYLHTASKSTSSTLHTRLQAGGVGGGQKDVRLKAAAHERR